MSASALLRGVEARLREVLDDLQGKRVGVQPDGRPPAGFGQTYVAVHHGGISGDDQNALSNDKLHTVLLTLTFRMGYSPKDRRGARVVAEGELLDLAERVADGLHMSYEAMNAANELIDGAGSTANGFVEPLKLQSISPPQEAAPEWVGAKDAAEVLTVVVTMGGARRVTVL